MHFARRYHARTPRDEATTWMIPDGSKWTPLSPSTLVAKREIAHVPTSQQWLSHRPLYSAAECTETIVSVHVTILFDVPNPTVNGILHGVPSESIRGWPERGV